MRRFNILYDRLRTGEFFQFYTLPFEQRFFLRLYNEADPMISRRFERAPVRQAALAHHHGSVSQIIPRRGPRYGYVMATHSTARGCEGVRPAAILTRTAYPIDCNCQDAPGDLRHDGQAVADAFTSTSAAMRRSAS